jgi:hypothetical protein
MGRANLELAEHYRLRRSRRGLDIMDRSHIENHGESSPANAWRLSLLLVTSVAMGCQPSVNVLGVYFPPWLVSAFAGLAVAYGTVWLLGRTPGTRTLAQSGLLFCSLTVIVGLLLWWLLFSSF